MEGSLQSLKQGDIVWSKVHDRNGNAKVRPVVIITASDEIIIDDSIVAVAITTTFAEPPPDYCVEIPWYRLGHRVTGLKRRSAAVCNWMVEIHPSDIEGRPIGMVPKKYLLDILNRITE